MKAADGTCSDVQERAREELAKGRQCVVCMDALRDCVILPCAHVCVCANCIPQVQPSQGILSPSRGTLAPSQGTLASIQGGTLAPSQGTLACRRNNYMASGCASTKPGYPSIDPGYPSTEPGYTSMSAE
eukprot:9473431-Pyramimonas_sp.AAC.2